MTDLYVTCHRHTSFEHPPHWGCGILEIHTGALVGGMGIRLQFPRLHGRLLSTGSPGTRTGISAQQDLLERLPEHLIEDGVEDGIDHGTGIAQPGDHIEDPMTDPLFAFRTHGGQKIEDEEG